MGRVLCGIEILKFGLRCGIPIGMEHVGNSGSKGIDDEERWWGIHETIPRGSHRVKRRRGWLGRYTLQAGGSCLPRLHLIIPEIFPSRSLALFFLIRHLKILAPIRKSCHSISFLLSSLKLSALCVWKYFIKCWPARLFWKSITYRKESIYVDLGPKLYVAFHKSFLCCFFFWQVQVLYFKRC